MEVTDFHYIKWDINIEEVYDLPKIYVNGEMQNYNITVKEGKKIIEIRNNWNHLLLII